MPYILNGAPLAPGRSFIIDDTNYSGAELLSWPREALEALPGMAWVEPVAPVLTAEDCLNALADLRWQKSQHFVFDGVMTQADAAIAVVNATLTNRDRRGVPAETLQTWKLSQADFRQWDEAQIEAFGFAIADHIQACFDREADLSALIVAAVDPAEIDITTGWPA